MTQSSWSSHCLRKQLESHQWETALHFSWACKFQKFDNGYFNSFFRSWHMSPLHSSCRSVGILAFKIQSYSADCLLCLEWTQWVDGCHHYIHNNSCDYIYSSIFCPYSFPYIISFNPYRTHVRKVLLFIFYKGRDADSRTRNYNSRVRNWQS